MEEKDIESQIAYVQITHVQPYFEESDLSERVTEYERNHNINRFMYEIPFTIDGRVRGNPEEQCKKRIILTSNIHFFQIPCLIFTNSNCSFSLHLLNSAQYSFPYIKKRLRVIQREFQDLSPIEVALDEMRMRVKDIAEAVRTQPTDLKKLQLRLQVLHFLKLKFD